MTLYVLLTGRFPFSWPGDAAPGDSHATRVQKMFARIASGSYMPLSGVSNSPDTLGTFQTQIRKVLRRASHAARIQKMSSRITTGFCMPLSEVSGQRVAWALSASEVLSRVQYPR